jgi:hypothetical protein
MLWLFGPRVERQWSAGGFTRYYLWCGLGGWLAHVLFFRGSGLVGASAAVYGVLVAYALRWPDDELYFFGAIPVKVKWLVVAYLGWDMVAGFFPGAGSGVAHLAHLGGAAAGWLYLRTPSGQQIDRLRHRIAPVPDLPDETPRAVPRSAPRPREQRGSEVDEIVAKSKAIAAARRPPAPPPPPKSAVATNKKGEELNLVLDKISEHGLGSLTSDERRLLEEMSRKLRDR